MTVSIARLTADAGLKYLLKTTMQDDLPGPPPDATGYYVKNGTPQARWLGNGLDGINRKLGQPVTVSEAKFVFTHAAHPDTKAILGRLHGQTTVGYTQPVWIEGKGGTYWPGSVILITPDPAQVHVGLPWPSTYRIAASDCRAVAPAFH